MESQRGSRGGSGIMRGVGIGRGRGSGRAGLRMPGMSENRNRDTPYSMPNRDSAVSFTQQSFSSLGEITSRRYDLQGRPMQINTNSSLASDSPRSSTSRTPSSSSGGFLFDDTMFRSSPTTNVDARAASSGSNESTQNAGQATRRPNGVDGRCGILTMRERLLGIRTQTAEATVSTGGEGYAFHGPSQNIPNLLGLSPSSLQRNTLVQAENSPFRIHCLPTRSEQKPGKYTVIEYTSAGLGEKPDRITIERRASSDDIERLMWHTFPLLRGVRFGLSQLTSGAPGQGYIFKEIVDERPSGNQFFPFKKLVVYLQPMETIWQEQNNPLSRALLLRRRQNTTCSSPPRRITTTTSPEEPWELDFSFPGDDAPPEQTPRTTSPCWALEPAPANTSMETTTAGIDTVCTYPSMNDDGTASFRFHCLPEDRSIPFAARVIEMYTSVGLGEKEVDIPEGASAVQVLRSMWSTFPLLNGKMFTMSEQFADHFGMQFFRKICDDVPDWAELWNVAGDVVFIHPRDKLWEEDPALPHSVDDCENTAVSVLVHGTVSSNNRSDVSETTADENASTESASGGQGGSVVDSSTSAAAFDAVLARCAENSARSFACMASTAPTCGQTATEFLRSKQQTDHGVRNITVGRSVFACTYLQNYISMVTANSCNLFPRTDVKFRDENGVDHQGLSREYFTLVREALLTRTWKRFALFEYGGDHLLISNEETLLMARAYQAAGVAAADLAFHTGYAFAGLSNVLIEVFKNLSSGGADFPVYQWTHDMLCDVDVRSAYDILTDYMNIEEVTPENFMKLVRVCGAANITIQAAPGKYEAMKYRYDLGNNFLVNSRFEAIGQFFDGLKAGGLIDFLSENPSQWNVVFPREADIVVTAEDISSKIDFQVDAEIFDHVELLVSSYLTSITDDAAALKHLVAMWTGSDILPRQRLRVVEALDGSLKFRVCSMELCVPRNMTIELFAASIPGVIPFLIA